MFIELPVLHKEPNPGTQMSVNRLLTAVNIHRCKTNEYIFIQKSMNIYIYTQ
jgi:hypothetical protein